MDLRWRRLVLAGGAVLASLPSERPLAGTALAGASPANPFPASLPTPYWWSGTCDANNDPGSVPLGATLLGMPACGPIGRSQPVLFPGNVTEYEWQCAELSMRYLFLAFHQNAYQANGSQVVQNYPGSLLVRIPNGTQGQAPAVGDVLSYGPLSGGGHTSVVTAVSYASPGNGTITVIEQNASSNSSYQISVVGWWVQNTYGYQITQWLHWPLFNLLTNASFETGDNTGWFKNNNAGNVAMQVYADASWAKEGTDYLEMNTSQSNGSVAQDVAIPPAPANSYTFSIWVRSRDGNPFAGTLALWGRGGNQENNSTSFLAGPTWTLISAPLNPRQTGNTSLRAEIYMVSTGRNLDVDGAQLINAGLTNASFETGTTTGWFKSNNKDNVAWAVYQDSSWAREGSYYMEMNTSLSNGSVAQDLVMPPLAGTSYTFSIWVRSRDGNPFSGSLVLWTRGGTDEHRTTAFTAGSAWILVSVAVNPIQNNNTGLRAEIYITSTGRNLDVDGAQLVNAGLTNSSFETGDPTGWFKSNLGGSVSWWVIQDPSWAVEGSYYMEISTSRSNASIAQDMSISPAPGSSYTFSIWVRSRDGNPFSGTLVLWALGGSNEGQSTAFTAGPAWTFVSAPVNPKQGGHTSLRAEIYMTSTARDLDLDAASLASGNAGF